MKLEIKFALAAVAMILSGIGYAVTAPGASINGWLFPLFPSVWCTWWYLYSLDQR